MTREESDNEDLYDKLDFDERQERSDRSGGRYRNPRGGFYGTDYAGEIKAMLAPYKLYEGAFEEHSGGEDY